jgi:hypothetical protein
MIKTIFFVILSLVFSVWAQSPWTQKPNEIYGQISLNIVSGYDELYLKGGEKIATERKISDLTLQGWLERGMSQSSTILLSFPVKILNAGDLVSSDNPDPLTKKGSLTAPGNLRLGWKQQAIQNGLTMAGQLWLEMPTGKYDNDTGLRTGYDAWTLIPSLNLGTSGTGWYTYGYFAFGYRSNDYSDFLQATGEAGYQIMSKLSIAVYIDWLHSLKNGSRIDPANNLRTGLYVNDQEYFAFGIKLYGKVISPKIGIALGFAGAFSGNFVPRVPAFNLALYYQ